MTDPTLGLPLLSLLLFTLPAGAALIWLVPDPGRARWIALAAALVDLGIALVALARFNPANGDFQLIERHPWIPSLNIDYALGVDGLTVAFLPPDLLAYLAAFLLFRILDVTKPPPARRAEKFRGGLGIMADDLIVGLYGNLILRAGLYLIGRT